MIDFGVPNSSMDFRKPQVDFKKMIATFMVLDRS